MFCKKCGKKIKDGILFCPHCGQKVTIPLAGHQNEAAETSPKIQPAKDPTEKEPVVKKPTDSWQIVEQPPSEGVSKSLILAVVIGILIIIIAVLAFLLFSKRSKEEEDFSQGYGEATEESWDNGSDISEIPMWDAEAGQEQSSEDTGMDQELVQEEEPSQYILPESDSAYLTKSDLEGLTREECRIARNELYARHGRRFDDKELQGYFDSCDWYEGFIAPADFDDSVLNEYEVANRDLIVMYEEEQGYR